MDVMTAIPSLLVLPAVYFGRQVDWEEGDSLYYLRMAFGASQLFNLAVILYLYYKASSSKDTKGISVPPTGLLSLTNAKPKRMTVREYDVSQVNGMLMEFAFSVAIVLYFHTTNGAIIPLIPSTLIGPVRCAGKPLFKWYVLGQRTKELQRPFVSKSIMMDTLKDLMKEVKEVASGAEGKKRKTKRKSKPPGVE